MKKKNSDFKKMVCCKYWDFSICYSFIGVTRRVRTLLPVWPHLLPFCRFSVKYGRKHVKPHVGCRRIGQTAFCDPSIQNYARLVVSLTVWPLQLWIWSKICQSTCKISSNGFYGILRSIGPKFYPFGNVFPKQKGRLWRTVTGRVILRRPDFLQPTTLWCVTL